ncbi:MAG: hypothetical protein M1814_001308 [Vezdaea aestivalis]|nr:MAG: hypothetical protein M1814_001308 [Vezdaea aestivalis]
MSWVQNVKTIGQSLRYPDDPGHRGHEIIFTHADLNPRNILVNEVERSDGSSAWRISGTDDWEAAEYFSDYWDYTKARFEQFRWTKRYNDYSKEYDVEMRAWEAGDELM